MTALEAAKDLIRIYVLRGDSLESLVEGGMGRWGPQYRASIGGYACPDDPTAQCRKLTGRQIAARPAGATDWEIFSLPTLYDQIRAEMTSGYQQVGLL